uniref:lysozyme n=1 Tax=Glossina austeni TaxID=7395 RepID=A0A1A9V9X4_GLOAU
MLWNTCSTLNILTIVALCITKSCFVESKKYMRCELSKELVERYQISKTFLSNYFLNDDISDDVECAKRIFEQKGFQYWNGWSTYCRNQQNLPNLSVACNINTVTPLSRLFLL